MKALTRSPALYSSISCPAVDREGGPRLPKQTAARDVLLYFSRLYSSPTCLPKPRRRQGRPAVPPSPLPVLTTMLFAAFLTVNSVIATPTTIYVDASASGANTGADWQNAYTDLQDALVNGNVNDTIWVAEGVYYPTAGADRTISFQLKAGMQVYGGFTNGMDDLNQRNWINHPTVLSGDIGVKDDHTDNTYRVIQGATGALLDGLIVQDGYAEVQYVVDSGAGLYVLNSPMTVRNCLFQNNESYTRGGAVHCSGAAAVVNIHDCTFTNNRLIWTSGMGGAVCYNSSASGILSNCIFRANLGQGGGFANDSAHANLIDCIFEENYTHSARLGGAVYLNASTGTVFNCLFSHNTNAYRGGGIYISGGAPKIDNSKFLRNTAHTGGGGKGGGGIFMVSTSAIVTNCLFVDNHGTDWGGGVKILGSGNALVVNCRFIRNTATYGSGICIGTTTGFGSGAVSNSVFAAGTRTYGGGVFIGAAASVGTIGNCLFVGNQLNNATWNRGAGLAIFANGTGYVENCTFAFNKTGDQGGAIYAGGTLFAKNSILWDNVDRNGNPRELDLLTSGIVTISYSVTKGGLSGPGVNIAGSGVLNDAGGNFDADPLFAPVLSGVWSADSIYDTENAVTLLHDTGANFEPGALTGRFVKPSSDSYLQFLVYTNTATSITVYGKASDLALNSADYIVYDYHLQSKAGRYTESGWVTDSSMSPCIDAGDPGSPYDNEPYYHGRRINIGAYGNTAQASKTMPPGTVIFFR